MTKMTIKKVVVTVCVVILFATACFAERIAKGKKGKSSVAKSDLPMSSKVEKRTVKAMWKYCKCANGMDGDTCSKRLLCMESDECGGRNRIDVSMLDCSASSHAPSSSVFIFMHEQLGRIVYVCDAGRNKCTQVLLNGYDKHSGKDCSAQISSLETNWTLDTATPVYFDVCGTNAEETVSQCLAVIEPPFDMTWCHLNYNEGNCVQSCSGAHNLAPEDCPFGTECLPACSFTPHASTLMHENVENDNSPPSIVALPVYYDVCGVSAEESFAQCLAVISPPLNMTWCHVDFNGGNCVQSCSGVHELTLDACPTETECFPACSFIPPTTTSLSFYCLELNGSLDCSKALLCNGNDDVTTCNADQTCVIQADCP